MPLEQEQIPDSDLTDEVILALYFDFRDNKLPKDQDNSGNNFLN